MLSGMGGWGAAPECFPGVEKGRGQTRADGNVQLTPASPRLPRVPAEALSAWPMAPRGLGEWVGVPGKMGQEFSPPPAPGQWGRSSCCPGQRPPWEVAEFLPELDQRGPKAFPADRMEPQEPAPGGGVGGGRAGPAHPRPTPGMPRLRLIWQLGFHLAKLFFCPFHIPCTLEGTSSAASGSGPSGAAAGGGRCAGGGSQAARSDPGPRPVPMTR